MAKSTDVRMTEHYQERKQFGKTRRKEAPRSSHGNWQPAADRQDPISLLQAQDRDRLEHLVPIKYGRMLESPFAFLRGSAVVMASDLASTPATGIDALLCGDAHLSNFGLFATPERKLVFDINDFDEVYIGAWEWDLKRLAASAAVAGRDNGFRDKACRQLAETIASTYRDAMERFSSASTLDMWYFHVEADAAKDVMDAVSSKRTRKLTAKTIAKARSRTQEQTLAKITTVTNGRRQIVNNPPLLLPFRTYMQTIELIGDDSLNLMAKESLEHAWGQYLDSLPDERRYLLQRYTIVDGALRVGGVGSVGTRCAILLLEARSTDDAIILQLKEAGPSVLEQYFPRPTKIQPAERVVTGQRLIQASSDIFLGWHQADRSFRNFYWRQLKDMKGSAKIEKMDEKALKNYLKLCTLCLARAHARTGSPTATFSYIGSNQTFAKAIGKFAMRYADQTEEDYQALVDAVNSGRVAAEPGV